MVTVLSLAQLLLYIPLLALLGQGALYLLAGERREHNPFYRLLRLVPRPFVALVRRLTPTQVADHHVPFVTFGLLLLAYGVVTFERIDLCLRIGLEQCR